ncbi:anti sigma factor C-terminal domain-containing protein [Paenibacillus glycanilyticus]|uniref:Sigma factor regulator C-terminal domain-containing protein n=1 Tax=Paenibacillus glycanilyticus TaxID=126569 RepID=A0ABQ6GKB7_9BACL|nr:anti sigma factor C-terminal domain-containing protein [Paenibacillus glycanilyticus]GLX71142.1 hypothetical protein MU1_54910 [Paenibacillus glycanilyticus]
MNDNETIMDESEKLSTLVKKARRRTIWRNAGISFGITLFILVIGWFINLQLQYKSSETSQRDIEMLKEISGPNQYLYSTTVNYGFLRGTLEYRTYKMIEGIPVIGDEENYEFSSWGTFSRYSNNSPLSVSDPGMNVEGFDYMRAYNPYSGEREMAFYLPNVKYVNYLNELPQLNDMNGQKLVELGISFDTNYTVEQIKAMLPNGVHPVWYWVDTYSNMQQYLAHKSPDGKVINPSPDSERYVYGFANNLENGNASEEKFLSNLEVGLHSNRKYKQEYERIYDYLRKDKEKPDVNDVRVIGVVVTGTADSLKMLQEKKYVKAAVLGAVVDKY